MFNTQTVSTAAGIHSQNTIKLEHAKTVIMAGMLLLILMLALAPLDVLAQTSTNSSTSSGDALWTAFKAWLFGGWGLLIAGVIVGVGVFVWMRRGIGEGLLVMVCGFVLFLIPAFVIGARNAGQALAT